LRILDEHEVDAVLLDLMLPDEPGLDVLPKLRERDPDLPVVVITAYSSIESAIEAMRRGAFHYVPKPFKNEEVLHIVRKAVEQRRLVQENLLLKNRLRGVRDLWGTAGRCARCSSSCTAPPRRDPTSW
jgi:Response regulator containing CheY-like receiver, AAA-type ATPase, and DNA-binding domains